MSTSTSTYERVMQLLQHSGVDVSGATPETGLAQAGLDSLAVAELLFSVEEEFGVNVGDIPMDQVPATIAQLVALIDRSDPVVKK